MPKGKIRIEALPWISDAFGRRVGGRSIVETEIREGDTIGDMLGRLAAGNPKLAELLFDRDTGRLSDGVVITINDRLSEAMEGLDTTVKDGDVITLIPAFAGG